MVHNHQDARGPSERGRSVIKCTTRCDHGHSGMGRERSLPAGSHRGMLSMAHSASLDEVPNITCHMGPPATGLS